MAIRRFGKETMSSNNSQQPPYYASGTIFSQQFLIYYYKFYKKKKLLMSPNNITHNIDVDYAKDGKLFDFPAKLDIRRKIKERIKKETLK